MDRRHRPPELTHLVPGLTYLVGTGNFVPGQLGINEYLVIRVAGPARRWAGHCRAKTASAAAGRQRAEGESR